MYDMTFDFDVWFLVREDSLSSHDWQKSSHLTRLNFGECNWLAVAFHPKNIEDRLHGVCRRKGEGELDGDRIVEEWKAKSSRW